MATREEIEQLIEDLDEQGYSDAFSITSAHAAALELIRLSEIAYEPLLEAIRQHPKYLVRGWAAWILGQIGDVRAIPALQAACQDENGYVRYEAQNALSKLEQ